MSAEQWWRDGWTRLPAQRKENDPSQRWPLDLQIAGPLEPLQRRLQANGWGVQPQANWVATLQLLDDDVPRERQPVLPATLDTERSEEHTSELQSLMRIPYAVFSLKKQTQQ